MKVELWREHFKRKKKNHFPQPDLSVHPSFRISLLRAVLLADFKTARDLKKEKERNKDCGEKV